MTIQSEIGKMLAKSSFIRVGYQIKINRKHRGMTIPQLAKFAKVTSKRMRSIERGNINNLRINTLIRIANAFDCAFDIRLRSISEAIRDVDRAPLVVPSFTEESNNARSN